MVAVSHDCKLHVVSVNFLPLILWKLGLASADPCNTGVCETEWMNGSADMTLTNVWNITEMLSCPSVCKKSKQGEDIV